MERRESLVDGRVFLFFFLPFLFFFLCVIAVVSCCADEWWREEEGERLDIPTVTVFRTPSFSYYSLGLSVVAALPSSLGGSC